MEHSSVAGKAITIQEMAEMGIAVALGVALSYLSKAIWSLPMGGTLELGIIPVLYIALRWGWRDGLIVGLALGLVTLITDPYFVHPVQILLDYPLPGLALGLAGLPDFRKGQNWWKGILTGGLVRYVFHVVSGLVFFASAAPSWHMSPLLYSLAYNAAYVIPSIAIALLVFVPLRRVKALWQGRNDS
jgi:thiamine transporter